MDKLYIDILMFIGRFSTDGNSDRQEVIECFTRGCCYWFAFILYNRFKQEANCNIVVDYIQNHFGCMINNNVYDITGDVTNTYNWELWDNCNDDLLKKRINDYCINF